MAAVAVIAKPLAEGTRQALVLTEDRLGHYPEFRDFFVRTFDLDRVGLSEPGFVRAPLGAAYALVFVGRSGEPFPWARGVRDRRSAGAARRYSSRQRPVGDPGLDDQRRGSAVDGGGPSRDRVPVPHSRRRMNSTISTLGKTPHGTLRPAARG